MDSMDAVFGDLWSRYHDQEEVLYQSSSYSGRKRLRLAGTGSRENKLSAGGLPR